MKLSWNYIDSFLDVSEEVVVTQCSVNEPFEPAHTSTPSPFCMLVNLKYRAWKVGNKQINKQTNKKTKQKTKQNKTPPQKKKTNPTTTKTTTRTTTTKNKQKNPTTTTTTTKNNNNN